MKIKNNNFQLKELEYEFAKDFSSPIFPVLAEHYFNLSNYEKAQKVCEVGLSYNANNSLGQYILAKTYIIKNDYLKAEKLLKQTVIANPTNIKALMLFIDVKFLLKRNIQTFKKNIELAYLIHGKNPKIKKIYQQLNITQPQKATSSIKNKTNKSKIIINEKLATKTMYGVLLKQKKYDEALKVLNVLKKNKKNKSFFQKEHTKIIKKIN